MAIRSESGNQRHGKRAEANFNQMHRKTNGAASIGANTVGSDARLFLKMEICGVVAKLLVDTGATLTLISTDLMSKVSDNDRPTLKDMKRQILNAVVTAFAFVVEATSQPNAVHSTQELKLL